VGIIDETRFVERLQFFNGQRLFASDLQSLDDFNRDMRRLHLQSLHQPGVGNGFAISGEKDDREVTVGPGYAIDSLGREIVLSETIVLPIPPVAGKDDAPIFFDLTVAYPDNSNLEEAETREGVCLPRGVVRLREAPVFCWVELAGENLIPKKTKQRMELQEGSRIRLARIEVLNCQLNSSVSTTQRQSARPVIVPYIASGGEKPEDIKNATILDQLINNSGFKALMLSGTVNTSNAGFLTTPDYSVSIIGPRAFSLTEPDNPDAVPEVLILDQAFIEEAKPASFNFTALLVVSSLDRSDLEDEEIDEVKKQIRKKWQISWMGVER